MSLSSMISSDTQLGQLVDPVPSVLSPTQHVQNWKAASLRAEAAIWAPVSTWCEYTEIHRRRRYSPVLPSGTPQPHRALSVMPNTLRWKNTFRNRITNYLAKIYTTINRNHIQPMGYLICGRENKSGMQGYFYVLWSKELKDFVGRW